MDDPKAEVRGMVLRVSGWVRTFITSRDTLI
jgi:hypothetical protein